MWAHFDSRHHQTRCTILTDMHSSMFTTMQWNYRHLVMTYWFANLSEKKYITDLIIWLTTTYHTYLWNVLYWELSVRSKWIDQKYYSNYACHRCRLVWTPHQKRSRKSTARCPWFTIPTNQPEMKNSSWNWPRLTMPLQMILLGKFLWLQKGSE